MAFVGFWSLGGVHHSVSKTDTQLPEFRQEPLVDGVGMLIAFDERRKLLSLQLPTP